MSAGSRVCCWWGLATMFCCTFSLWAATPEVRRDATGIEVVVSVPREVRAVELQVESFRNRPVGRQSDRSPLAPASWVDRPPRRPGQELWFPVLDIMPTERMQGVAEFAEVASGCRYVFNGMFNQTVRALEKRVIVPAMELLYWENLLFVEGGEARLARFYLSERVQVRDGRARFRLHPLSENWRGRIAWRDAAAAPGDGELGSIEVGEAEPEKLLHPLLSLDAAPEQPPTRGQLADFLRDSVGFLLRARDQNPASPTRDGFFLLYDLDAATYRTSHWMWAWGVDIRMLLEASRHPEVAQAFDEDLKSVAVAAGRRSLDFQWDKPGHPADGLVTVRWNPGAQWKHGAQEFVATADALFLAGWAWAPLYEATGDPAFLRGAQRLCDSVDRLSREHALTPQDWLPAENSWRRTVLNEIGFGVEGFAELHRVRPDSRLQAAGRRFIDPLIEHLERDDGLWNRNLAERTSREASGEHRHTRGQAWVMEGLLAAHRLAPEAGYLRKAERLAAHLIQSQHPSGCWSFEFHRDPAEAGIAEKGAAVWSVLLYRLYETNGDPAALRAARRALWFCLNNRYRGSDSNAAGGIFTSSPNSGIVYRYWYRIACTYTSAWAGLAALQEWKLQTQSPSGRSSAAARRAP